MHLPSRSLALALIVLGLTGRAGAEALSPYHELDPRPKLLALTPGLEGAAFAQFLDDLEAAGMRVPLAVAGAGAVIVEAPGIREILAGRDEITRVLAGAPDGGRAAADPRTAGLVTWWNRGFDVPEVSETRALAENEALCGGALRVEDVIARNECGESSPFDVIQYAPGRVVANLVFPESGALTWPEGAMNEVTAEFLRALNWWNLKTSSFTQFLVVEHRAVRTYGTEPANTPVGGEEPWVEEVMTRLGYVGNCAFPQVNGLNRAMRLDLSAHWAFTQFVINTGEFADGGGALAYAYLGGPHTVALRYNGTLGPQYLDQVMAHEIGHIFQALDEYNIGGFGCSGCGQRSGYLLIPNGNCALCSHPEGKCIMRRAGIYTNEERENMESAINPCRFTRGQAGFWDADGDNIIDVLDTTPETVITSAVADTLDGAENVPILGTAWDVPYPTTVFEEPRSINTIRGVEFSVDGTPWRQARPADGFFTEVTENFEIRLPEMGGGAHFILARAVNTSSITDPSPTRIDFFVHDVKLRKDLEITQEGTQVIVKWQIEGEDFESVYELLRRVRGRDDEQTVARVSSLRGRNDRHRYFDDDIEPGLDYIYRLFVDIPAKGRKALGTAQFTTVLADNASGGFVAMAPNPTREAVLVSVRVPVGPRRGPDDIVGLPDDFGDGVSDDIRPVLGAQLSGPNDGDGISSGNDDPVWRNVHLTVYDVQGRLVRDLGTVRKLERTRFNVRWDGRSSSGSPVPTGAYFVRVDLGYARETAKVVLVR